MASTQILVDGAREAAILRVVRYITEHPDVSHAQQDLADLAAMNKRTFSQVFQTVMGVGVKVFVRSVRVAHAKRLLDDTDLSVAQVMRRSGFSSTDAGRRAFYDVERIAPMYYRSRDRSAPKT